MVLVSVVVAVRNRGELLAGTLESVLQQTLGSWECVVVDDRSSDGSWAVAQRYAACDRRFRPMRTRTRNAAGARNRGLAAARGRYVAFLDGGDLFPPGRFEWQVRALERERGALLVYGETLQRDPISGRESIHLAGAPRPRGERAFEALLTTRAIHAPTVRRRALKVAGGFDESLAPVEEWDAWLALARRGRILFEPRLALQRRLRAGDEPSDLARSIACARRVVEKHLAELPPLRRARLVLRVERGLRARYGPRLLEAAEAATRAGDWDAARPLWRALARLDPARLRRPSAMLHALRSCLPAREAPAWRAWIGPLPRGGAREGGAARP